MRVGKDAMDEDFLSRVRARDAADAREGAERSRRPRTTVLAVLAAFLLGTVLSGYLAFVWREEIAAFFAYGGPLGEAPGGEAVALADSPPAGADASGPNAAAQAVEIVAQQQGGLENRVVAMEQRIARLDLQAQAAAGNAARAESLLIVFATRRAIERGEPLGYLADQLELRFGDVQPNAVSTVIAASQQPVTLDQLMARLEGLAPRLSNEAQAEVSWVWLKRELGELFVVRRETSPSPQPEKRLERARLFLQSGRIGAAVAEVQNLPRAEEARDWTADAERYANAQRALDLLEKTAVLEPRDLRDGAGRQVQQLSPAVPE